LNNNEITGARSVLLNITSGTEEITMDEISEITDYVISASSKDTTLIWGMGSDEHLGEKISVTVIATGFKMNSIPELYVGKKKYDKIPLRDNQKQRGAAGSRGKSNLSDPYQKTLDFTIKDFDESEEYILYDEKRNSDSRDENEQKLAERVRNLKNTHDKMKDEYAPISKNDEIEELENIPAYVRKKLELNNERISETEEVSKYRLTEENDNGGPKIKSDNSYLHDNVD
ncbi:MAG TPA: hypothetical protein ENN61_02325, partial [Bacteroidaceae bacterium]|nr:hypothetical protein [Bacteroidaceae bacterium]